MRKPLPTDVRVLLIEDDPLDAELVTRTLRHTAPRATVVRLDGAAGLRREIEAGGPDAVVAALELRKPLRQLSERQREVFQFLASGLSSREIAVRLGLSVKTIETHRANVMKRLGVQNLAELVRAAVRLGVVAAADA